MVYVVNFLRNLEKAEGFFIVRSNHENFIAFRSSYVCSTSEVWSSFFKRLGLRPHIVMILLFNKYDVISACVDPNHAELRKRATLSPEVCRIKYEKTFYFPRLFTRGDHKRSKTATNFCSRI
ncbi:hypothetical protein RRG08_028882 [Elysia crispata]|uniref:Uncharacterized protein n=1 Tax=Elysia crispata TaxID=231223 RepID=A0AAE0YZL5_9GAST|nr:hypothetical protein RRG08_028882 [Elysia crispata]